MIDLERVARVTAPTAVAPTLSDVTNDPKGPAMSGLYVIATGNVKFTTPLDDVITLAAVPAFTRIPIAAKRVWSTGTTATVLMLS